MHFIINVYVKRAKNISEYILSLKYKRVMAIAAMVAGIIAAIGVFSLTLTYPKINPNKIEKLSRDVAMIIRTQTYQNAKINEVNAKIPKDVVATNGGTGFLIDTKGFIITNAHVIGKSHYVDVVNCSGQEFHASIIFMDNNTDIALLQIQDSDFVRPLSLPYVIKDNLQNIGEEVYTLGYPKNDIVYNAGYLSSISGYNGDTSNYQVQLDVNPGNSGGPLFNKKGEVIGILSTREINANSVAFAIKSKSIFNLVDSLRSDMHKNIKINESNNLISAYNRITQIKKEESYIYLVRSFQ